MSVTHLASIAMLFVGFISATVDAQENRLLDHFDDVVTDGKNKRDFYDRLVLAQGDLAAAAANPVGDVVAIRAALSHALAELLELQNERRNKKQLGRQGLPDNYTDSLTALMLVSTMPESQWRTLTVNRAGRDIDFTQQLMYLVRNDFGVKNEQLQAPGPLRDIVSNWIETIGTSLQGQQAIFWGLQNDFKDPCLTAARRILSQRDDSSLWLRPQDGRINPGIRLSMQRTAIAVVEKWGGDSDAWALLKLVYQDDPGEATNVEARYRALAGNQALGVLMRMRGLQPTDYRMRETSGLYSNYTFQTLEDQAAARDRFKAWWDFLPPWKAEQVSDEAELDLATAIDLLMKDDFDDLAAKRRAVNRIEQQPEAALPLLETYNLVTDDQVTVIRVLLDRIASKLADQLNENQPTVAAVSTAREQFVRLLGTPDSGAPLFDEMVEAEPGLMAAFSAYLDAPASTRAFYGEVLVRIFMRRESAIAQRFQKRVNEFVQAKVAAGEPARAAGMVYPGNLEDDFFASLAAILFVRGEKPLEIPSPLLSLLNRCLYSGLENGSSGQKSPVLEFIRSAGDRGEALGQCLKSACLAAETTNDYSIAFSIALRYRMADTSLRLARRVCDPEFVFPNVSVRGNLLQLAVHSYLSFGKAEEDLPAVVSLLEDEQRIRLGGVPAGQLRRHIEVREFALMAAKRMVGRNPVVMQGAKVTGYCAMKRQVALEIIEDPERWDKIQQTAADWLTEFAGDKGR